MQLINTILWHEIQLLMFLTSFNKSVCSTKSVMKTDNLDKKVHIEVVCIWYSIAWINSHTNDKVIGYNKNKYKINVDNCIILGNRMKTVVEYNRKIK